MDRGKNEESVLRAEPIAAVVIARVALSKKQETNNRLVNFFRFPKTLINLLNSSHIDVTSIPQANQILLTKLSDLNYSISAQNRGQTLGALQDFADLWWQSRTLDLRLSFAEGGTIKADDTSVYLPEIGHIKVANPAALRCSRTDWISYQKNFCLVSTHEGFFVEIIIVPSVRMVSTRKSGRTLTKAEKKTNAALVFLREGAATGFPTALVKFIRNMSPRKQLFSAYARIDYEVLGGHQVSGGLPGLGKSR